MNTIFESKYMRSIAAVAMMGLAVFLIGQAIQSFKAIRYIGVSPTMNTITVSGHGEVLITPDIATVSFSVQKDASTVVAANNQVTDLITKVTAAVKALNVDAKDIQTSDYSVQPKYDYSSTRCTTAYCPPTNPVLVGYTVSNSVTIKIRNLDDAGKILTALADNGATNVSGLSFSTEDPNGPQNDARAQAITKAQEQAQTLAKQLGVTLVGISSFSDSSGAYPMTYAKGVSATMDAVAPSPATPVSVGQNKISSDVSITYQIQ